MEDLHPGQLVLGPHGRLGIVVMTNKESLWGRFSETTEVWSDHPVKGFVRVWYRDLEVPHIKDILRGKSEVKDELVRECIPITKLTVEEKEILERHCGIPYDVPKRMRGHLMTEYRCKCHDSFWLSNLATRDWWALYNVSGIRNIFYLEGVSYETNP